jgi:hypothetical protein
MYKPKFNSVLVEIDDADAKWGSENNENMLGKSYSKGKIISIGEIMRTPNHPTNIDVEDEHILKKLLPDLVGKDVMWNEGVEAGTTFEEDGKLYGFIYWSDIRGVKE